jgi:DNA-binding NarL/FixJ family response regulator
LVLGSQLDLALAWAALKNGADGFVHAQMHPAQVLSAVEVVQKGELAAPRQLLRYFQPRQCLHGREDSVPYKLGQLVNGQQGVGPAQVHRDQVDWHTANDNNTS